MATVTRGRLADIDASFNSEWKRDVQDTILREEQRLSELQREHDNVPAATVLTEKPSAKKTQPPYK